VDTEQDLLTRARRWDKTALVEIYEGHNAELYRYAARQLGDSALAEECVAETFSRFLHALRSGGGPDQHLRAYLYRIAHNWISDCLQQRPLLALDADPLSDGLSQESPLCEVIERAECDRVRAALAQLTPEQRQVVVLHYLEGWAHAEIARALFKSVGSVKALQHRALATLRRLLMDQE
jgi:RNA polymerase sigma-70 factor (ECF subfamily)